jgi:EmrB/QacA subfamily drug resistance transporter
MGMDHRRDNDKWRAWATVALGAFMSSLDGSILNVALPQIAAAFHAPLNTVEWVVMAYMVVITCLLLTWGRLGDMLGYRRIYILGFSLFTVGSLLCGLAWSIAWLVAFRALQAMGAGMMMAMGPAVITASFPATERGRALGMNGMVVAAGLAIGPTLGGFLLGRAGWRAIFYVNLPIGIFGASWAGRVLRRTAGRPQRFDLWGAATLLLGLLALLLALSQGSELGWSSFPIRLLLAACLIGLTLFGVIETRVGEPMLDLNLFKNRLFAAANAAALLNFLSQAAVTFLLPFYLEDFRALPPHRAGLLMTSFPLALCVVAPLSGSLSDRIGSRVLSTLGMVATGLGLLALAQVGSGTPLWQIVWRLMLVGVGAGLFQSPNSNAILGAVPRHRAGVASGMIATMRNLGMVAGVALAGALFASRFGSTDMAAVGPDSGPGLRAAFMSGLALAFWAAGLLALAGAALSLLRGGQLPAQKGQGQAAETAG